MTASTARRSLQWTVAGVLVAVLGVVIAVRTGDPTEAAPTQTGVQGGTITGDHNTITNYQQFQQDLGPGADDARIRETAADFADVPAGGTGPWPFIVVDTAELGLIMRTDGERSGKQIGSAGNGATLWVDCATTTTFTPPARNDVGPAWVKVRWPDLALTKEFHNSAPADEFRAWAYRGYLVPAGHDGAIPRC